MKDILNWPALEKEIDSCSTHDYKVAEHGQIDDMFDPFLAARNPDQGEANADLDGNESKAPRLLEDVEPLF